jgi:predicted Zn-dependent protease
MPETWPVNPVAGTELPPPVGICGNIALISAPPPIMLIDFSTKTVLVLDDHPGMRASIRTTLSHFGVVKTDMASTAFEATRRIKDRAYDIVVCDYDLGDGRDGQQLLEELRLTKLIPLTTVFLMVTAERGYEKVMAAAELAPDDYLIKPFTAEVLHQRLCKVIEKKTAFTPAYLAMAEDHFEQAIEVCDSIKTSKPIYTIDAMRLKAELLMAIGRIDEAQQIYQEVIAMRAVPWARMGLARALYLKGQADEAEMVLLDLCDDAPDFLSAYDLLAKVQEAQQKSTEAQDTLARAVTRSPHTIARQKNLGELALANDDPAVAERAFGAVVARGLHSILRSPDDHARLARAQVDQGKLQAADATLKDLRTQYPNNARAEFSASVMDSLKASRAGDSEAARAAMDRAFKLKAEHGLQASEAMTLDLARAAFANGAAEEGQKLVAEMINNDHENKVLLNRAQSMFASLGMAEAGEEFIQAGVKKAVSLNNEAVLKARQGDLEGAISMLIKAATELPNNVQILLNAAHAILTRMKQSGWDDYRGMLAINYLEQVRSRSPDHPKYVKVNGLYRELAQKYGVLR